MIFLKTGVTANAVGDTDKTGVSAAVSEGVVGYGYKWLVHEYHLNTIISSNIAETFPTNGVDPYQTAPKLTVIGNLKWDMLN